MTMNALARSLIGLVTSQNSRFVIPVYQRPYSWDEEQCEQLWEDVLSVGKRPDDKHFTGSIVWIQDGVMSEVTPLLLIDGQQRVTTVVLLMIALARYAKNNPDEKLNFSYSRLVNKGYLIDDDRHGDERYKLLLSQGDRATLISLLEHLVDEDYRVVNNSSRLIANLEFFERKLAALDNPNAIWDGLQRLEVVSISLDATRDNPQLIFESMNSTGKDLSSADLIRNFVLMGLPRGEQEKLYQNHWRRIEQTLGEDTYDRVFDEFIRNYLTILYAPEPLTRKDVYPIFKRHVTENGFAKKGWMVDLLSEMEDVARYYAAITSGTEEDPQLKEHFDTIATLDMSVLNPLLLSFYQDYEAGAFEKEDFIRLLRLTESYVLRRAICDAPTNSLNKFFPSIIGNLNKVQEEGGDYVEAFQSLLYMAAGTTRRFPTDDEFSHALLTRDSYLFRKSFFLLTNLENFHHPKDPHDFASGSYTIEHIMPQNALAHSEWRQALGEAPEEGFEALVNNIGNLTVTAYNSELSDGTFTEKKERCIGGYANEYMAISAELRDAESWGEEEIRNRAENLTAIALKRWPGLDVSPDTAERYVARKQPDRRAWRVTIHDLVSAGLLHVGDVLEPGSDRFTQTVTLTDRGDLVLRNGEKFSSPSSAASRVIALEGGSGGRNGWDFWRLNDGGPKLSEIRRRYDEAAATSHRDASMVEFWNGFYEYCANRPGFTEAFRDPSTREPNRDNWASFGIGLRKCDLTALVRLSGQEVAVQLHFSDEESYKPVLARRSDIEKELEFLEGTFEWDEGGLDKTTRVVNVARPADLTGDSVNEVYEWLATGMHALRKVAHQFMKRNLASI